MVEDQNRGCVSFRLDGRTCTAAAGTTIWEAARERETLLPHLCHLPKPGYEADGNCRACMVEIEGERVLAASCIRQVEEGMVIRTATKRARAARRTVIEMLLADQPPEAVAHDQSSHFWDMAALAGVKSSRFPGMASTSRPPPDTSHVAMHVYLDACIQCNLCVRACR
ncbi:MAG: 2Fe-2S iron-sulfur cluster-binding protein, partial [Rhodobacteraceae bacterium]|nr:2Fe-2S iron-sulfur cluster-binding protein [Paracoccaceae bacterium]